MKLDLISPVIFATGMVFSGGTFAEEQSQNSGEQIFSPIVSGPQEGETNVQYLNRQLRGSESIETDDMKLQKIIRESRTKFNFFMANSLSLPVSIIEPEIKNNASGGVIYSDRPPIKIEGIPDWIRGTLGVKEISFKITRSF